MCSTSSALTSVSPPAGTWIEGKQPEHTGNTVLPYVCLQNVCKRSRNMHANLGSLDIHTCRHNGIWSVWHLDNKYTLQAFVLCFYKYDKVAFCQLLLKNIEQCNTNNTTEEKHCNLKQKRCLPFAVIIYSIPLNPRSNFSFYLEFLHLLFCTSPEYGESRCDVIEVAGLHSAIWSLIHRSVQQTHRIPEVGFFLLKQYHIQKMLPLSSEKSIIQASRCEPTTTLRNGWWFFADLMFFFS